MAERMPGPLGFASTYKMSCWRLYCAELGLSPSAACCATWIVCSPTMAIATGDGCSINTDKCIHKYWYPYIYIHVCMCVCAFVGIVRRGKTTACSVDCWGFSAYVHYSPCPADRDTSHTCGNEHPRCIEQSFTR